MPRAGLSIKYRSRLADWPRRWAASTVRAHSRYGEYRAHIDREGLPRATRNGALIVAAFTTAFMALDWFSFSRSVSSNALGSGRL